jgi:predicted RNA polymerase sigma factor
VRWERDGVPEQPRGWLIQTASRRLIDQLRSERSRRDR